MGARRSAGLLPKLLRFGGFLTIDIARGADVDGIDVDVDGPDGPKARSGKQALQPGTSGRLLF